MAFTLRKRGWTSVLVLSCIWFAQTTAIAEPDDSQLRLREAARKAQRESSHRSPSFVVDGTPRTTEPPARLQSLTPVPSRRTERSPASAPDGDDPRRSLTTDVNDIGMASDLGGDDVIINESVPFLQVNDAGEYFILNYNGGAFDVLKSTDGGETWTVWSSFSDPDVLNVGEFLCADGTAPRLFVLYNANSGTNDSDVRVAYADFTAPVPTWTIVTVLSNPGIEHGFAGMDIDTDVVDFQTYFVYIVARGDDGDGQDVWFARSADMGTSYEAGYRIADTLNDSDDFYYAPHISYGSGSFLHAAYTSLDTSLTDTWRLRHLRASNFGSGGLPAWGPELTITPLFGDQWVPRWISASSYDGSVIVAAGAVGFGSVYRYSTDNGATWPPGHTVIDPPAIGSPPARFLGSGDVVAVGLRSPLSTDYVELSRSTTTDLSAWSPAEQLAAHPQGVISGSLAQFVVDPARGNRVAVAWYKSSIPGEARFDAEHRRDPGYPNTDVFVTGIAGGAQTPPAIAEVDGDPQGEIVFGTISGDIWVYNHDGTVVPGWPVNIGSMPFDAPVAVGNLVGGPRNHVVAGNATGEVYAFEGDGTLLPGWPVTLNDVAPVYVSIGSLGPTYPNYVVTTCGSELRATRYDGTRADSPPWASAGPFSAPAAIGDVDDDGMTDVVTLADEYMRVWTFNNSAPIKERFLSGVIFSGAPTLADVDNNGDLEIAAPTANGKMYLMKNDGSDYSASWPATVLSGSPLTSAVMANFVGSAEKEIVFAEQSATGHVWLLFDTGVAQTSYPRSTASSSIFMPPIIEATHASSFCDVLLPVAQTGYGFTNINGTTPGWPRNFGETVEESFAAGDIDLDGRKEIVVLGVSTLRVLDVGVSAIRDPDQHWPMYGYDAQRTGCLACDVNIVGVDDTPIAPAGRLTLDVRPNPFNPSTTIAYEIETAGPVALRVYDVRGRVVDTIVENAFHTPNRYRISYRPPVVSGVYFLKIESGGKTRTRKIHLLK